MPASSCPTGVGQAITQHRAVLDGLAVEPGDDVAGLDPALLGRAAAHDIADQRAAGVARADGRVGLIQLPI